MGLGGQATWTFSPCFRFHHNVDAATTTGMMSTWGPI